MLKLKKLIKSLMYIKLNNKKYKIKEDIEFKIPIIHPYSKELIYKGIIVDFNLKNNELTIYLSDGLLNLNDKGDYCSSWVKNFKKTKLESLIK